MPNRVTNERALQRFTEIGRVSMEDIEIVNQSNNNLPWGDLHDVTYELEVKGVPYTGTCTSGWMNTSPMVCKLYPAGAGYE